jgi:hypothetical protein
MHETNVEEILKELKALHEAAAPGALGACVITDAQTGTRRCFQTSPQACTRFGGKFVGGPCGPITKLPDE